MMHDDQLLLDADVAAALVREQFPEWRDELVERVLGTGTVNALFRIGEHLCARFRLRPGDPETILDELRAERAALDDLAVCCPVPVPRVVGIGAPGEGYPLPWSIATWLPGETPDPESHATSDRFAQDLVDLGVALRSADTRGRPFTGQGRGGLLRDHDAWVATCLEHSDGLLDVVAARRLWDRLHDLPTPERLAMTHGDLIPGNLLVEGERLVGVIDGGGFAPADPALDLIVGWHLLGTAAREVFRQGLGVDADSAEWQRGAAWALEQSLGLVWYYAETNPEMAALGRSTVRRLLAALDV